MKKSIAILLAGIVLSSANIVSAAGVGSVNLTLQDSGDGRTLFTFSVNSFISQTGLSVSSTTPVNQLTCFTPVFDGWINDPDACAAKMSLSAFGFFANPNGEADGGTASAQLYGLKFLDAGGGSYTFELDLDNYLGVAANDLVSYSPGTDSGIIDVPFAAFNPGVYNYTETGAYYGGTGVFNPNVNYTLTVMTPVPEPPVVVLAGLGGLALLVYRRRGGDRHI